MINRVTLVGRLGADVELRHTPSGKPVTTFRVATDCSHKGPDGSRTKRTDWHTVVVFGSTAQACADYIGKGSLVFVEGSLRTRKWTGEDKVERFSTEVIARLVRFLDNRRGNTEQRKIEARMTT